MPWLINASQVDKFRKAQKNIIILDASWHLEERNAEQEFLKEHIVGAKFLDLNALVDTTSSLPNMMLRDETMLSERIGALGISNECKIIFYDNSHLHTSCRALWCFKFFGHLSHQLYILDGGMEAWKKYGGKIEEGNPRLSPKSYTVNFQANLLRTLMQMKNNLHHPKEQVIDMRHPVRYAGGAEHRNELRRGHIPGSFCFPYFTMFESDGRFKPLDKIRKQLSGLGIDLTSPIVTTCGSGISASILNFILDLLNHPAHSLYDGSWNEWGYDQLYPGEQSLDERPVVTSLEA